MMSLVLSLQLICLGSKVRSSQRLEQKPMCHIELLMGITVLCSNPPVASPSYSMSPSPTLSFWPYFLPPPLLMPQPLFLLFPKSRHAPTSGPLQWQGPLSRTPFPRLSHMAHHSLFSKTQMWPALTTLIYISPFPSTPQTSTYFLS